MHIVHDSDFSITDDGFVASWNVTAAGSSCRLETVADSFSSLAYNLNSGTASWRTDWLEVGEADGPSAGIARISNANCSSGYCLRIGEPSGSSSWSQRGVERAVDLTDASGATLTFNYYTGYAQGSTSVQLQASRDGSNWTTLAVYDVTFTNFSGTAQSFDLTPYIDADTRIRFLSQGSGARTGFYVDDVQVSYQPPCLPPVPRAEYRFDADGWSGDADEVVDSSGNSYHGRAVNATTTAGKICNAADFSATGISDYVLLDNSAMDGLSDFTLSIWTKTAKTGQQGYLSGARARQNNEVLWWFWNSTRADPHTLGRNGRDFTVTDFADDTWRHLVWVRQGASNCYYIDGVHAGCSTTRRGALSIDPGGLVVGQEQDSVGGRFASSQALEGLVDELLIFDSALSAADINAIYSNQQAGLGWDGAARTCPVAGGVELQISHDGQGIHCLDEAVTVLATDLAGQTVAAYGEQVQLSTSTGRGSWSLSSGNGVFSDPVADDGLALYTFAVGDGGRATFNLRYTQGASVVDVDVQQVTDSGVMDDDSEGLLTFAPSGFTVTAAALPNPPPPSIDNTLGTRVAGRNMDLHLTAYGTTDTDPVCGVIESYQGSKTLFVWQDLLDPSTGTLAATVAGVSVGTGEAAATAIGANFSQGQAVLRAKYKDVGRLRLQMKDIATASQVMYGATDDFVSQPADLVVVGVTDLGGLANPGAADLSGAGFVSAGETFAVVVEARDAEGSVTPNYGQEAAAEGLLLSSATLVAPSAGSNGRAGDGTLVNGNVFTATATPGRFENRSVAFDEVGIIALQAQVADGDYLGSGNVTGSTSTNVGRFYVDHFDLENTAIAPACGTFTYMGQPQLGLSYDLVAKNSADQQVLNYDTALLGSGQVALVSTEAEFADNGTSLGARIDHNPATWQSGRYSLAVNDAEFTRLAVPDGAYPGVTLGVSAADPDGRLLSGLNMHPENSGDCVTAGDCTARSIGNTDVYFGRLTALPASGSEYMDLPLEAAVEVYGSAGFTPFVMDNCTTYQRGDVSFSNFTGDLLAADLLLNTPVNPAALSGGRTQLGAPLLVSAPEKIGSVDFQLVTDSWLRFPWQGGSAVDPMSTATFGSYRGHDRIVFWREE